MRYDDKELAGQAIEMIVLIKSSKTEVRQRLQNHNILYPVRAISPLLQLTDSRDS